MAAHHREQSLAQSDPGGDGWNPHWDDYEGSSNSTDPWSKPISATDRQEEAYELTEEGHLWISGEDNKSTRISYKDGDSIDWLHEENAERARQHEMRSHRGLRGILIPALDSARTWFVVVATGIGIGIIGAWLDILAKFMGDLREGRCSYGFFYNQVACCSGIDPGEVCREWQTWSEWLGLRSVFAMSLLQAIVYILLAVVFACSAAVLVITYAPYAFHTGIPEIKAILNGYVLDAFLSPWTLLIKSLGLALSVASGLSLGKEGPLVHIACCIASLLTKLFPQIRQNEAQKRKLLAAAASAGVSVAFGSPLGGVLFGLEELDTFAEETETMWRGFVASVIAAVALQYISPFGNAKLVLFQVTASEVSWKAFELIPWLLLGVIGGLLGTVLIKLNVSAALYRHNSQLRDLPILEVAGATVITAAISYLVVFLRVQTAELVANLFNECDPSHGDYHGLCNSTALWRNIFLLIVSAGMRIGFTAWSFGMMVPAGVFLPSIAIGASVGRAVGLLTQGIYRAYPKYWLFSTCPPDPTVRCVSPGFYAVIGAAAMLGGVTRMTISLVVIMFELTGAVSHVLPIMLSVMVSKWVGDIFGHEGIYASWIALRRYPWLPTPEFRDKGETAASLMQPLSELVIIRDGDCSANSLARLMDSYSYHGFPVVRAGNEVVGFVPRTKLKILIDSIPQELRIKLVSFSKRQRSETPDAIDASSTLETDVLQLRHEVPQELVVTMFQKMNLHRLFFTRLGVLEGMTTKRDVVALLSADFPFVGGLEKGPNDVLDAGHHY